MVWWNTCVWTGLSLGQQSDRTTGYSQGQSTELLFHGCVWNNWHVNIYKNAGGGKYALENELSQHWISKTIIWIARMGKIIAPVNRWEVYSPRDHLSWRNSECKGNEASYPLLGCYWSSPALLTFCCTSQLLSLPPFHITWISSMLWLSNWDRIPRFQTVDSHFGQPMLTQLMWHKWSWSNSSSHVLKSQFIGFFFFLREK